MSNTVYNILVSNTVYNILVSNTVYNILVSNMSNTVYNILVSNTVYNILVGYIILRGRVVTDRYRRSDPCSTREVKVEPYLLRVQSSQ